MRIAALVPYHQDYCAGQRFRVEAWARGLAPRGVTFSFLPFSDPALTAVLHGRAGLMSRGTRLARCFLDQLARVLRESRPDVVYIYREAALVGPAVIERLTRRWRAPIVYDLDEPLFVPYVSPSTGRWSALKCFGKTDDLMRMSDRVWAVNRAIGDYAARFSRRVSIVPMAVDIDRYRPAPPLPDDAPLRVGWMGTRTSQPNLQAVVEPLARLHRSHGAVLSVVADEPLSFDQLPVEFTPWTWEAEVPHMHRCQVALVPVRPDGWSPWKFYYKLVQCMSMAIPVVASPIGSNLEIVEDGKTGFLAETQDEWSDRLRRLADDPALRRKMGAAARRVVEERFSLSRQIDFLHRELEAMAA
jgi:glycosyltransferase involved in cell wall biosynthesis